MQRPDLTTGDGIYKSTDAGETWIHLGSARRPTDPSDHRGSRRSGPALRRRPRPPLRTQRGAGRLPLPGRRADFREGPLQRRGHGRRRRGLRSVDPQTSTPSCGSPGRAPGRTVSSGAREAACSNPPTAATPGGRSERASPPGKKVWAGSGSAIAPSDPNGSTPSSARPGTEAGSTGATTPARAGGGSIPIPRVWGRDGDFNEVKVDPKDPDIVYSGQSWSLEVHRRRRHLRGHRGAPPAATTISASGSTPTIPSHRPGGRPGRHHHGQRRGDVELLVQPAHRPVLPRHPPTTTSPTGCAAASRKVGRPAC